MGIVETLQYLESSRRIASVNDSHSEGRLVGMPMANGECSIRTQSPKLKRRKISAVRDFPPGCGRFGQLSNLGPDKEAASVGTLLTALTESLVSGGKNGDGRGAENLMPSTGQVDDTVLISGNVVSTGETVESLTALEHEIYDSLKIQHQLGAAAPEEEIVAVLPDRNICSPPDRSISISKGNLLEKTAVKNYPPRRKISAVRDLPPLCGKNASLEARKFGQEKSLMDGEPSSLNTVKTNVKQTCEDIHDEEFHKSEYVENVLEISGSEVQPNCNGHVVQEMEREDEYKVNSKMNVVLVGTRKTCIEPSQKSNGCLHTKDVEHSEEKVEDETEVYQAEKSTSEKCLEVSYYNNQLHEEDFVRSEPTSNSEIVLGLMAASNCPWRKGKGVFKRKSEGGMSERKPSQQSNGCQGMGDIGISEETVGTEMVVYQAKKSPGKKCIDVSYCHNQLHKEVLGISERTMDRVVVLGLMAASNCPWRKGKEVSMRKPEDGASESKPSQESNGCQGMGGVGHSEEKVGKEMVVYQAKETLGETCLEVSYYNNQLHKEDFESLELTSDTVVVLGLMAASNCPWRKGKRVSKHKAKGGTSESEQNTLDLKCQLEGSNTVLTKVDSDIGRKSGKKIFRKARKSAYQGTSLFWDEEYSFEHDPEDLHVTPRSCYSDVSPHLFSPSSTTSKNHENNAIVNRHMVKETLRLFQALCRKLLREEEGKSKEGGISRQKIDYSALKILKDKGKYVNMGKHIGADETEEEKRTEASNKRKNLFDEMNHQKKHERETHYSDMHDKTRASHISVTEDGSTAENEDVADSEVEGSSSVPISQHAEGVKRFVGSGDSSDAQKEVRRFADSNVVDLNGQKRFNISSENEYKLGNMAYGSPFSLQSVNMMNIPYSLPTKESNSVGATTTSGHPMHGMMQAMPTVTGERTGTQPVNPGNLPVMFGYSPVQLPMLDKDNSWGAIPHAQQFHPAYAGRNPPNSAMMQVVSHNSPDVAQYDGRMLERARGDGKQNVNEEGASSQVEEDTKVSSANLGMKDAPGRPTAEDLSLDFSAIKPGIAADIKFGGSGSCPNLPWVSTKGQGPNGKTISGVTYRYSTNQIKIVCACHGLHMSPEEFVRHASDEPSNPESGTGLAAFPNGNPSAPAHT